MGIDRLLTFSDRTDSFPAKARETVSGGYLVVGSGGDDVVHIGTASGGATSVSYGDIEVATNDTKGDSRAVFGLAKNTATSGNEVTVVSDGIFILEGGSSGVTPGYPLYVEYKNAFTDCPAISGTTVSYQAVGKALTGASSHDTYFIGKLRF